MRDSELISPIEVRTWTSGGKTQSTIRRCSAVRIIFMRLATSASHWSDGKGVDIPPDAYQSCLVLGAIAHSAKGW